MTELSEEAPKPVTLINITTYSYAPVFMHVNPRNHFLLCAIGSYWHDQSLMIPAINFHMSPHLYFTCSFMHISPDLSSVPHLAGFAHIFLSNLHSRTLALRWASCPTSSNLVVLLPFHFLFFPADFDHLTFSI